MTPLQAFENVTGEVLLPEADFNWHWEESAYLRASFWGKKKRKRDKLKKRKEEKICNAGIQKNLLLGRKDSSYLKMLNEVGSYPARVPLFPSGLLGMGQPGTSS